MKFLAISLRFIGILLLGLPYATAGEREYMDAVGKLLGLSQSPNVIREYCANRSPNAATQLRGLYEAWLERNGKTMERVNETLQRADEYMRRCESFAGSHSIAESLGSVTSQVRKRLDQKTTEESTSFCTAFPAFLKHKDVEFATEIPRLIELIAAQQASIGKPK